MRFEKKNIPVYISAVIVIAGIVTEQLTDFFLDGCLISTAGQAISAAALVYLISQLLTLLTHALPARLCKTPEAAEKTGRIAGNILLTLSFLPFAGFIVYCVLKMFIGANWWLAWLTPGGKMIYGFPAFAQTFLFFGTTLCLVPVFPSMLIFQIVSITDKIKIKRTKESLPL